jgi:very-short-patch-repair endonuclease
MTEAEARVWYHLRGRELAGAKFRRQQPIGDYIVDFVCAERMLIIEIDGGHHDEQRDADADRDLFLTGKGYRVLRFWNNDVMQNIEGVQERILQELT